MSSRPQARTQQHHSAEIRQVYDRLLAGASVRSRHVEVAGGRVHLLEQGAGPPVVLLHGTANPAGFLLPLLHELRGVHAIAPDRPGVGLSDPIDLPAGRYRETAVAWLDRLLDTLELKATTLLGHSGGGAWALWYALAHPDRVERLVLLDVPGLPRTRCPLPVRLVGTPGLGQLLSRLAPPSRRSMLRLASAMGEKATLARRPDLVDLLVAAGRDPITDRAAKAEFRALISPFALLTPSGFRRRARIRPRRAPPAGHAHLGGLGRAGPGRQRPGRPGSNRADSRRTTGGAAHRAWALARAAHADRRGGDGVRAMRCNPDRSGTSPAER
jgi:pimeloyl-ACP methyl ester carboxylesterase